ncbi:MAG TPA: decaprenyl-phosphate phosphoribosyltransferase [Leptospiraceae bacterium]|nr:decaprenyl-phosphate phosphoribosyltransferase [Leptospiraceae bacterium]HMY68086.1 decaprenyl-phosphate phosphoribosyltransferase [Leptospiraceae bacterium]HNF14270.1 decaprenyl-phosphate phosphoribosyltransferase [Leptospiraceae bacterium]HNI97284.1 decaprenyl-phosphate phosphoribosyltransferase [Leptospiraceae bacterium]HNM03374.1 decaprenyl-phosphate phosphoribosyltransferase [Leptospiraceae bacterium]
MIKNFIILIRPHQWIKNFILFAGIIFGKKLNDPDAVMKVTSAFFLFSFVASCQYVFNDYMDRAEDAMHPEKKNRPLASGAIDPGVALTLMIIMLTVSLILSFLLSQIFFGLLIFYFLFNLTYSSYLKHLVILDVMSISIGFVIRAVAGAAVINVQFSSWLLLCTFMLALFWGFSKRRGEIILMEEGAKTHRKILDEYSVNFLDMMLGITATMTLMSYVMYTFSPSTIQNLGTDKMVYTIPIVVYAILRSLYIIYIKNMGHNPTKAILTDKSVLITGLLWVILVTYLTYFKPGMTIFHL